MNRFYHKIWILAALAVLWMGCKTLGDLSLREEERNFRRQKRGNISDTGMYQNDFYQFSIRLPEGWSGSTGDPPNVLRAMPSSKQISNSDMRKNISISVRVIDRYPDETMDEFIARYATARNYEKILQRPAEVEGFLAQKVMFYYQQEAKTIKVLSLVVLKETAVVVLDCNAPASAFDNFEARFGASLDSFKSTRKELPELPKEGVFEAPDPALDYVNYIVSPLDTMESLAKMFLGSEDRMWMIVAENEMETVKAGERIKIPRTMPYHVTRNDSWEMIAHKILGDSKYAGVVKEYNVSAELTVGSDIRVPLYFNETPVIGDSYIDVARRHYDDPNLAQRILEYNNMEPLESLEKVKLPISFKERFYVYKVQPNDSLAWIARWLTGDANNFRKIAEVNNIDPPYRLIINQELKIPTSLVPDPAVFDRPIPVPRPTPRPTQPKTTKGEVLPTSTPAPASTPTPTPRPIRDTGIFDIE
jgi:LysM repeat protein